MFKIKSEKAIDYHIKEFWSPRFSVNSLCYENFLLDSFSWGLEKHLKINRHIIRRILIKCTLVVLLKRVLLYQIQSEE